MQHLSQQHVAALGGKDRGKLVSFTPDFSNSLRRLILSSMGQINRFLSHRSPQNLHQELWNRRGNERSASKPTAEVGSGPRMAPWPPLTCAGGVLQAASLPEGGQGLAFGPRRGPGGHAGGHVARISSVRMDWPRAEWVFGGMNVGGGEREDKEEEEEGEEKDAAQMLGASGGVVAVSLRACVRAYMCLHACYVPMSRDFHTSVKLESIPLQREKGPAHSRAWAAAWMREVCAHALISSVAMTTTSGLSLMGSKVVCWLNFQ